MARITFPIVKHTETGPAKGPGCFIFSWGTYGQIRCEGPNGEVLLLTYLRPDTAWLNEPVSVNQLRVNSYDPISKQGVAYFNAYDFAWHKELLSSGRTVQAEVDNLYPGGNRIYTDVTIPPAPSSMTVPDVLAWLRQNPNIFQALKWNEPTRGGLVYSDWPAQKQTDFRNAFATAYQQQPFALADPPPNLATGVGVVLSEDDAWKLFCAHAAYSLAVEHRGRVPWSITTYNASDLELLLHSGNMFRWDPALNAYELQIAAVPASPDFTWCFLESNGLIGLDRISTIANLLNWCRNNLTHYFGMNDATDSDMFAAHWGYSGYPPVSRIIQGTIRAGDPQDGVRHFTAGCWGTTAFLIAVLRSVNIAVESMTAGDGHTMPHFTTDDLYLSHGDDPYSRFSKCTPPFDAKQLLIDKNTFNTWLGSGVPIQTATNNVGRRPAQLTVQYLSDYVLHMYCKDQHDGLSAQDGSVYKGLAGYYPNFTNLYPDLWSRMDKKLLQFGTLGRPLMIKPLRPFKIPDVIGPFVGPPSIPLQGRVSADLGVKLQRQPMLHDEVT